MHCPTTFATSRDSIAGIPVVDLANQFGTPLYVYDLSIILQRIADLNAFDAIRYAQKALSNVAILDRMRKAGVVVDAVSAGEIKRALKAGFVPNSHPKGIVYTADVFDREALDLVVEHNIHCNVGSPDMIGQLGQRAPGRNISLRINPGLVTAIVKRRTPAVLNRSMVYGMKVSSIACDALISTV